MNHKMEILQITDNHKIFCTNKRYFTNCYHFCQFLSIFVDFIVLKGFSDLFQKKKHMQIREKISNCDKKQFYQEDDLREFWNDLWDL